VILQIVNGLEYAHRRGVTHRDLKASNVIISSIGEAKLVDFGLAGVDDSGDGTLGRIEQPRTIDYAALEKIAGMRDDSVRSDIYFLGTIAYLALCGMSALTETRDRNERANPGRFTNAQPLATRAPDLPRDVVDVVARMMHLDPLERWQTAGDVKRAIEAIIARRADGTETAVAAPVAVTTAVTKGCVMLVESDEKAQQTLRQYFTKLGYRVLLTENPQRALVRFSTVPPPADALVLCSHKLGQAAVDAFNTLSSDQMYAAVPALLLVGAKQHDVAAAARTDARRRVVRLPMPGDELGRVLRELVPRSG
jgi:serine/threonine-protein kinase